MSNHHHKLPHLPAPSAKKPSSLTVTPEISRSTTPLSLHHAPRSFRPYLTAIMTFGKGHDWFAKPSRRQTALAREASKHEKPYAIALTPLFAGIAADFSDEHSAVIATAVHDSLYLHDFQVKQIDLSDLELHQREDVIADHVVQVLRLYEEKNFCKFIGAGFWNDLAKMSPKMSSRLWADLDIVPISMEPSSAGLRSRTDKKQFWDVKSVDEQADSVARKCIMYFGPQLAPILQVGFRGVVEVDAGFNSQMCNLADYEKSCGELTWKATMKYADELKAKKTKIAFFSSTPQGGGVALMRHALVRFATVAGVDLTWYVPKPKPGVFRITKTIHNILQGVADPGVTVSHEDKATVQAWIDENAHRYWLSEGGPLRHADDGGADVIVIDDPQMPGLIPLARQMMPHRPILYRSHIQIRSDLASTPGTPQYDIWQFLWNNIQEADVFLSHPMPNFVPNNVPRHKVIYMPATTDWLDGLNKPLSEWDMSYYGHLYNMKCLESNMTALQYPARKYIIQIARFDPSKGIPDVLRAYAEFRRLLRAQCARLDATAPQLLIVGNGSIDDPDGTRIYDETISDLETHYPTLVSSISVMRLQSNDQLLNTLISNAHVVLQLSIREGFEVKVSEALHKGRPVIATNVGGIPLQIHDGRNGFLVESGDWKGVATHLLNLFTDDALHASMSRFAADNVSDEVGTVGNALCWFYLAARTGVDSGSWLLEPKQNWVNNRARRQAAIPYAEGENLLPRASTVEPYEA